MRIWLLTLIVLSLAACSSAPPRSARSGGSSFGDNGLRTMPPGLPRFVDHSIGREEISIEAMSLIGVPYRWGGNTPDSGFDCSGLVRYIVGRAADVDLPRTTADMSRRGEAIEPDEIAPGDLIFFNTTGRPHSHVGIYVGKLRFVNAPSTGGTVRLDYLTNPYWAKHFDGIRRVAPPLTAPSPFDAPTELATAPPAPAESNAQRVRASAAPSPQSTPSAPSAQTSAADDDPIARFADGSN
ncbi:MAG: NlpC/P60 family protein [Trinickia sp.]|uniref:C40 family peptidase n=1 Tax=Trinickia sp. TaxID=2571163 RepID=UPI003F7DFB1C